jgi:hypothetical protein
VKLPVSYKPAVLADYGFITVLLSDDWNGADFLAIHKDGQVMKIQLKSRLSFEKKYLKKDLYICFRNGSDWFIYPHDELFERISASENLTQSGSWENEGKYTYPNLSEKAA